jgi:protoporphyrinogen oxidase
MSDSAPIAVLGAGPMGLAVAYQLVREGKRPVIYEADDRVGGMTASFDFNGLEIERFYHFHCTSDHAYFDVLKDLGLSDRLHWVATKMGYYYQGNVQPWGNPIALLKFRGLGWVAKFRYGLHAFLCTKRSDWRPLDKIEATVWIKSWVGTEAWEVLWKRLFHYKFYHLSDSLSAAWIWSRVRRIGRSRSSLFAEKLGYLEGGSTTLLQAMQADIIARGGEFRLSAPVSKVHMTGEKVIGLQVGDGPIELYEQIISTIPLPYVPRLMPDLPADILEKFAAQKNVAVVCVIVKLAKSVTENFWLNVNDPDMDIPGLVEYTNLRPLDHTVVYVPYYMPADLPAFAAPDADFIARTKSYLQRINPDLSDNDFTDMHASRYRFAQPVCGPNFLETVPPAQLPIQGLWVADTSYYYPEDRGISESIQFGRDMARDAVRFIENGKFGKINV